MAIYHLSVKTVSRSAGRSATAAAAYRAGVSITDQRTGEVHDYTRKGGVESAVLVLPVDAPEWASDRAALWNAAEQSETRKNSTVAREFEIALPAELSSTARQRMAHDFARELVERHGCAADVAIHAPGKGGDNRNHHAHILLTTRRLGPEGFGAKTRELDDRSTKEIDGWRARFANLQNERLVDAGLWVQVDHRSLAAQGVERAPTQHLGPTATGYERRTGEPSAVRLRQEREAGERLANAKEAGELERQSQQVERSVLDLSGDLSAAKAERDRRPVPDTAQAGVERFQAEMARLRRPLREPSEQPAPAKIDPAEAERQRIERMSAAELSAEIARVRPPLLRDLVERQPELMAAREDQDTLAEKYRQAQAQAAQAARELENWRSAHPVRAKAHDAGLVRSSAIGEIGLRQEEAQAQRQRLAASVEVATEHLQRTRNSIEIRLAKEQAPAQARVAELERIERQRQAQEQAERAKTQALEKSLSAFEGHALKRELQAHSYGDTGKQWNALPESLREFIEDYNRLPKAERPVVLERMRDNLKRDPQGVETLTKQLDQGKERGRGMSR